MTNVDGAAASDILPQGSRAWLGRGIWDCDEGFLELSNGRLRFVTTAGDVRLDADATECAASFPRGSARTGLRVRTASAVYRIWFSNPYFGLGGFAGLGSARSVAIEWRDALKRHGR
jgi:hypothetical protein